MRWRAGTRLKYSDGRIYRVGPDGAYRREDGGKLTKGERKAAKRARRAGRQGKVT